MECYTEKLSAGTNWATDTDSLLTSTLFNTNCGAGANIGPCRSTSAAIVDTDSSMFNIEAIKVVPGSNYAQDIYLSTYLPSTINVYYATTSTTVTTSNTMITTHTVAQSARPITVDLSAWSPFSPQAILIEILPAPPVEWYISGIYLLRLPSGYTDIEGVVHEAESPCSSAATCTAACIRFTNDADATPLTLPFMQSTPTVLTYSGSVSGTCESLGGQWSV